MDQFIRFMKDIMGPIFGAITAFLAFFASGWAIRTYLDNALDIRLENWKKTEHIDLLDKVKNEIERVKADATDVARLKDEMNALKSSLIDTHHRATRRTTALTHICLSHLPQLTYTQQIPPSLMVLLKYLTVDEPAISNNDKTPEIDRALKSQIALCSALYQFASDPFGTKHAAQTSNSVLSLFDQCISRASRDPFTKRDIVLRKVQVLRQTQQFDQALSEFNHSQIFQH